MAEGSFSLVGPLGEAARELLVRAFGPVADEVGAAISTEMKVWRARRIQRLAELWRQKMADKAVPEEAIRLLPFGSVYRVLEAASAEDEDDVLDLWACLLANAMDPSEDVAIEKVYIDLLSAIGATEVLLLRVAEIAAERPPVQLGDASAEAVIRRLESLSVTTRQVAYENLRRLGCVLPPSDSRPFSFSMPRLPSARENAASASGVAVALETIVRLQRRAAGAVEHHPVEISSEPFRRISVNFALTPLGKHLLRACGATSKSESN